MPQIINTNIASLNTQRNLNSSQSLQDVAIQRLSSGLRINTAKDDAAGMAIADRLTTQIRGLNQATRNAQDAVSLTSTAEGALGAIGANLQRIRELAVQSANATNSASDRASLQQEAAQLIAENDRIATQTEFNGLKLLDGTGTTQQFQVGANAGQTISVAAVASMRTSTLGVYQGFTSNGVAVGTATSVTATTVTVGSGTAVSLGNLISDAKDITSAINAASVTGLSATANATVVAAATGVAGTAGQTIILNINNVALGTITLTGTLATDRTAALNAINAASAQTGVTAVADGTGLSLQAADGRNIVVTETGTGAEAAVGLAAATTTRSTVNLSYVQPTGVTGSVVFAGAIASTQTIGSTGTALSALSITSPTGANAAITAIDAALTTVNEERAKLGAIQNRFDSTISRQQAASESLTASRSRIQDADYAEETAKLTRAQILQQAGVAMLAQANALPQNVLALLRG